MPFADSSDIVCTVLSFVSMHRRILSRGVCRFWYQSSEKDRTLWEGDSYTVYRRELRSLLCSFAINC